MQMCEVEGLEFGWYNHSETEGKCVDCWVKESCEATKLKKEIAIMSIESIMFLENPNIQPLIGMGEYARRYDQKVERLVKLIQCDAIEETKRC